MVNRFGLMAATGLAASYVLLGSLQVSSALAQTEEAQTAAANAEQAAPEPLSDEEMEILVARIALYPDDLVAVIVSASLYPLQVVQAQRFLDKRKDKPDLAADPNWDGSVVSLLNYPDIVKMMSDDLEWTQTLGEAITAQQKDVLAAIQQLRDKAVAMGVIKSDDKVKVVTENDNVVIQSAAADVVYVPQYEPEMLYEPDYVPVPISYYPDPYPYYYYPTAPYFAGFVTGAIWGGIVDWDDGFWGGDWDGGDIDIDCNNCFNNVDFDGKINMNDVDWKNVDRSKIDFDKSQFNKMDKSKYKNSIKSDNRNSIKNKSADLKKTRTTALPGRSKEVGDVRKSTLDGLKKPEKMSKPSAGKIADRPSQKATGKVGDRPGGGQANRPVGKSKVGARPDKRPANPSPLGEVKQGKKAKLDSGRGAKSMGGGIKGGGGKPHKASGGKRRR